MTVNWVARSIGPASPPWAEVRGGADHNIIRVLRRLENRPRPGGWCALYSSIASAVLFVRVSSIKLVVNTLHRLHQRRLPPDLPSGERLAPRVFHGDQLSDRLDVRLASSIWPSCRRR